MTDSAVTDVPAVTEPPVVDNSRAWLLTAAPLLILVIDAAFLYSGHSDSSAVGIGVAVAVTVVLATWDSRYLRGRGTPVPGAGAAWIVPGYLYQRSKVLGQSQAPLAVWIAAIIVAVTAGLALDAHFVTLNMPGVQTEIEQWAAQQSSPGTSVACPSKDTYAVGSTFVCSVSDVTGTAHVIVKVETSDGAVTWQLVG